MRYDKRNRENIDKLGPNTKVAALQWYLYCLKNNIEILVYETIRTKEKQKTYVAAGKSLTMDSYHIVGQALDFAPVNANGDCLWNGYKAPDIQKAIKEAKRLGFTWGGDWSKFVDSPHLQYEHRGYGSDIVGKPIVSKPVKPVEEVNKYTPLYTSIVDYLKANKKDSSFAARSKLALQYGVKNYTGTAAQNIQLLKLVQ